MLQFVEGGIYHIHNTGCGAQAVFFQKRNYEYFLNKIKTYIEPYADVLHCELKLNAFHLLIRVRQTQRFIPEKHRIRTFAESIGIMLRSYAQAINNQENRKGVLWQGPTQAEFQSFCPLNTEEKAEVEKSSIPAKTVDSHYPPTRTKKTVYSKTQKRKKKRYVKSNWIKDQSIKIHLYLEELYWIITIGKSQIVGHAS